MIWGYPHFRKPPYPPCWMHPLAPLSAAGPWRLHTDVLEAFAAADDFAHGTARLLQVLQTWDFRCSWIPWTRRENKGELMWFPMLSLRLSCFYFRMYNLPINRFGNMFGSVSDFKINVRLKPVFF
jgi:hypothetical protein